jgi:hypothetical protein
MHRSFRAPLGLLAVASLCFAAGAQGQAGVKRKPTASTATGSKSFPSVQRIQFLSDRNSLEIEIESSGHLVPEAQVLSGPDRLVVDFPNAIPGKQLRSQSVNRGAVKDVRVGLFTDNPPVTRIVFDLSAAQSYQVFPNGRSIIVKLSGVKLNDHVQDASLEGVDDFPAETPATGPGLVNTNYAGRPLPFTNATSSMSTRASAKPSLEVSFNGGQLAIRSNKATLSEILNAVHQRTGAEVPIPAGAEQEQVAADIGPGPAAEVLAHLLNGSRFNFLIMNSASDPRVLDRVILTPRDQRMVAQAPAQPAADDADGDGNAEPAATRAQSAPAVSAPPAPGPPTPEQEAEPND